MGLTARIVHGLFWSRSLLRLLQRLQTTRKCPMGLETEARSEFVWKQRVGGRAKYSLNILAHTSYYGHIHMHMFMTNLAVWNINSFQKSGISGEIGSPVLDRCLFTLTLTKSGNVLTGQDSPGGPQDRPLASHHQPLDRWPRVSRRTSDELAERPQALGVKRVEPLVVRSPGFLRVFRLGSY